MYGSFLATMMISIEHVFVIVNRLFGTFVWILVIVEFILLIDSCEVFYNERCTINCTGNNTLQICKIRKSATL